MLLASVELFTFPNIWIRPVANGKSTAARTARDFQQLKTNLYGGKNRIWQSECRLFICRGLKFLINLTHGPIWLGIEKEKGGKERERERMRIYISSYIYNLSIQVLLFSFTLKIFKNSYFSSNSFPIIELCNMTFNESTSL